MLLCLLTQVLGRHGHLVQVNAAGRQVAADRGWALVDFEAMAQWYAQPKVCTTIRSSVAEVEFTPRELNVGTSIAVVNAVLCTSAVLNSNTHHISRFYVKLHTCEHNTSAESHSIG